MTHDLDSTTNRLPEGIERAIENARAERDAARRELHHANRMLESLRRFQRDNHAEPHPRYVTANAIGDAVLKHFEADLESGEPIYVARLVDVVRAAYERATQPPRPAHTPSSLDR